MELLRPGMLADIRFPESMVNAPRQTHMAQLVSFDEQVQQWTVVTFSGEMVNVQPDMLHILSDSDLQGCHYVLGPRSDLHCGAKDLAKRLSQTGFAVVRTFLSEESAQKILDLALEAAEEHLFVRLARDFEQGYLGRGRTAKTLLVDPKDQEAPEIVRKSVLGEAEKYFIKVCSMLQYHSEQVLGFQCCDYSDMMMQLPLDSAEASSYPAAEVNRRDAEEYIEVMHRRRLTLLMFLSPATTGSLTLHPRKLGNPDVDLQVEPRTILCIMDNRFEYSFQPKDNDSLVLQTLVLDEPALFVIESVIGDAHLLGALGDGPPPPQQSLHQQVCLTGMYCRYGGNSTGSNQFWVATCKAGTDGVTWVDQSSTWVGQSSRWDWTEYHQPDSRDGVYTQHGCFAIEGLFLFDGRFFDLLAQEAKFMNPLQRQVMEVSYMALDMGGWDKMALQKGAPCIGCFVGMDKDDWMEMEQCRASPKQYLVTGTSWWVTANRLSSALNLRGASMTIDTACSSSLVATHVAKLHLRNQEYEPMQAAVVNGVNIMLSVKYFQICCGTNMLSRKGRCFTYNDNADGYARAELCGSGTFKVQQASQRGSLVCLAGTQVNQDGLSSRFTAPNGPAQEKVLQTVLRETGANPNEIDCIECHGTGTPLRDAIEINACLRALSSSATVRQEPLLICASKSMIGHGEGGAGFAGFLMCCGMVMHCESAANLHCRLMHEYIDMDWFPCYVHTEGLTMRTSSAYAGVNSFGFGGTNAHGMAWGKNTLTSRGVPADNRELFRRKLEKSDPAEITVKGDSIYAWETTGIDPRAELGDQFIVEFDEHGDAFWEKVSHPFSCGVNLYIQGSHNSWRLEPMYPHSSIKALWIAVIIIGCNGEEQFQIFADASKENIFFPAEEQCTSRTAEIHGPGQSNNSWLIRGQDGQTFQVEFYLNGDARSITWF